MADPELITSRRHPFVKELTDIREDRASLWIFLEGPRLVEEALKSGISIETLVVLKKEDYAPAQKKARRTLVVSGSVFKILTDVETPQGVIAICSRPACSWTDLFKGEGPLLVLDGIQDPGNAATILRTAEAAGASGIVTTQGTAHLFSSKALRAAMGSSLRIPVLEHLTIHEVHSQIQKASYTLVAAAMPSSLQKSQSYVTFDWKVPCAIVLGQEGKGLSEGWASLIQQYVHIPMQLPVESLNVSAAAAILLYEARRRREFMPS